MPSSRRKAMSAGWCRSTTSAPGGAAPTPVSAWRPSAMPSTSNPAPRFADDAGVRTTQSVIGSAGGLARRGDEALERVGGGPRVDRLGGDREPLLEVDRPTADDEAGA